MTYRDLQDKDTLLTWARSKGEIKLYSIVHENGDVDEENPTPYEHTHFFVWWKTRVRSSDTRFADIDGVHPNIQTRRGMDWAKHVVMVYHLGHKKKACGKKYYIEPLALWQDGVEGWKFEQDMWELAKSAPSMQDACLDLGFVPKSISDVKMIRAESKKRTFDEVEKGEYVDCGIEWDRTKKSLIIAGPPGICKTAWAMNQFNGKGYTVTDIDDLKSIPDGCEGLIFDDMEFAKLKMSVQKHVFDVRKAASIRCRNTNGRKPAIPAIFTTNNLGTLCDMSGDGGALTERAVIWHAQGAKGSKSLLISSEE